MVKLALALTLLLVALAGLASELAGPCHFGECEWNIVTDSGYGTLRVNGSSTAISDLTVAAGWTVVECGDSDASQDIRVACHDPSKGCNHLYLNGAEHTVVRLPEECSSKPFAIVAYEWEHGDQSIPDGKQSILRRRDGSMPTVRGIRLTSNHSQIDSTRHGNVTFSVQLATSPEAAGMLHPPWGLVGDASLSKHPAIRRSILAALNDTNNFEGNQTSDPEPFELESDQVSLFSRTHSCPSIGFRPAFTGGVDVSVKGRINGTVEYGAVIAGTIVPPDISDFSLYVGLDAVINGTLNIDASLTGTISTGKVPIVPVLGIPGLAIPGVVAIGPYVTVYGEASAMLGANLDLDVDLSYSVIGAQLFFPPSIRPNGSFVPGDSGLRLGASPRLSTHARVEAHIIPTLSMGINLLDGFAETAVSLELDTSAGLDLSLSTSTSASVSTESGGKVTSTRPQWEGCVGVDAGFSVNAVAEADLSHFFSVGDSLPLFGKTFQLYEHCFGSGAQERRALPAARDGRNILVQRSNRNETLVPLPSWQDEVKKHFAKKVGCNADPGPVTSIVEQRAVGA